MNIAISTLVTPPQKRGVGNYVDFLLQALQDVDHDNQYLVLVGADLQSVFSIHAPNFKTLVLPFRSEPRLLMRPAYIVWQNSLALKSLRKAKIDVLHIPNLVPIVRSTIPTVVTVHDLAEYRVSKYSRARQAYRRWVPQTIAKNAARVITVSDASKRDFSHIVGYPKDKIDVTYEASAIAQRHVPRGRDYCKQRYGIDQDYILHVGSTLPHKNLDVLIRAFVSVKERKTRPLKLVLVGAREKKERMLTQLEIEPAIRKDILLPGYVPDDDLPTLYHHASLFVFPSAYEGFGLPVLEAMGLGAPVITSNVSSLPEVAGDAALLVDPGDADMLARAITRVLDDDELRRSLIEKGQLQAAAFSWERCARETIRCYEHACTSPDTASIRQPAPV